MTLDWDPTAWWTSLGNVIAFSNWKGGVGKTTATVNLGAALANEGKRVLVIDLNSQGTVSLLLGLVNTEVDDQGRGLFTSITTSSPLQPVINVRPNLDVLPGGDFITLLDDALASRLKSASTAPTVVLGLARVLAPIAGDYDYIFIDTPPENETLLLIALGAARFVLVPMRTDDSSRYGLSQLLKRFEIAREHNPYLMLLGLFVFASTHSATGIRGDLGKDIGDDLGTIDLMMKAFIRHSEKVARDSSQYGRTAEELAAEISNNPSWTAIVRGEAKGSIVVSPTSKGVSEDFQKLKTEVLERYDQRRTELIEAGDWP